MPARRKRKATRAVLIIESGELSSESETMAGVAGGAAKNYDKNDAADVLK